VRFPSSIDCFPAAFIGRLWGRDGASELRFDEGDLFIAWIVKVVDLRVDGVDLGLECAQTLMKLFDRKSPR